MKNKKKNFNPNKYMIDTIPLDAEEAEFIRDHNQGAREDKLRTIPISRDIQQSLKIAAQNTLHRLAKEKMLSLRISSYTLDGLKSKAADLGMPYQTLIGTILHQYVTGKIKAEL